MASENHPGLGLYLSEFIGKLGLKANGRKHSLADLADASQLSRTTIYNWVNGATPDPDNVENLAKAMAQLAGADSPNDYLANLNRCLARGQSEQRAAFKFIEYWPISSWSGDGDTLEEKDSSFLARLLKRFWQNTRGDETAPIPAEQVSIIAPVPSPSAIWAGLFPTARRTESFAFVKTPVQVPLNALAAWRDVNLYCQKVLPTLRREASSLSPEAVIAKLSTALLLPESGADFVVPIAEAIKPIVAEEESGWEFLSAFHDFGFETSGRAPLSTPDPESYLEALTQCSTDFIAAASGQGGASIGNLRLPVIVADELSCFKILRLANRKRTDLVMLADPAQEVVDAGWIRRPRYCPAIGYQARREHTPHSDVDFPRAFEEFLWSYTSVAATEYVRLYSTLCGEYGKLDVFGGLAPLYFLRWLSLDLPPALLRDIPGDSNAENRVTPSRRSRLPDSAWRDILATAQAQILANEVLRSALETALKRAESRVASGAARSA